MGQWDFFQACCPQGWGAESPGSSTDISAEFPQNQTHWSTCFWSLANWASFAPRSVFLSSFPWSPSIGQLLRVLPGQGGGPRWDESVAAQGQRPSRSGVSCPGLSLHVLLPPQAAWDSCPLVLCFHPSGLIVGTHPTWVQACPPSLFSPLHLEPGGMAALHQPSYHWHSQHGNMEKRSLLPREIPQDPQALRTGDSSGFNRWDPQVPQHGAES